MSQCHCRNLDARGARNRRRTGFICLLLGFLTVVLGKVCEAALWLRLVPAVPFFVGYLGLLQSQTKTCVVLALLEKDTSQGRVEPIEDRETGWQLKRQALKLIGGAALLALLSTLACLYA